MKPLQFHNMGLWALHGLLYGLPYGIIFCKYSVTEEAEKEPVTLKMQSNVPEGKLQSRRSLQWRH